MSDRQRRKAQCQQRGGRERQRPGGVALIVRLPPELIRIHSYYTDEAGVSEPAMFLVREGYFGRAGCVLLSQAYLFDDPKKNTSAMRLDAVRITTGNMMHLAIDPEAKWTARDIATFIVSGELPGGSLFSAFFEFVQDGLDELVAMPPKPRAQQVAGEVEMHLNGERKTQQLLVDVD